MSSLSSWGGKGSSSSSSLSSCILSSCVGDDVGERGEWGDRNDDCGRGGRMVLVVEEGGDAGGGTSLVFVVVVEPHWRRRREEKGGGGETTTISEGEVVTSSWRGGRRGEGRFRLSSSLSRVGDEVGESGWRETLTDIGEG